MEQTVFIWDLDGTLLDSYPIIVQSLRQALAEQGVFREVEEIYRHVIAYSVGSFIEKTIGEASLCAEQLRKRYAQLNHERDMQIKLMPHAQQVLQQTADRGCRHYVYTHKGSASCAILENTGILPFFEEVVTSRNGFASKPNPAALDYLIEKYRLKKEHCFYVGDRRVDVECAVNAGIKSILFLPEGGYGEKTGKEDRVVFDLLDIIDLFRQQ
ncbi:MAG: HAD-IA family hydrolase [Provencibacterium sp.]|nr:HAD-IA family hydrolase [Provencibacterium sp.]